MIDKTVAIYGIKYQDTHDLDYKPSNAILGMRFLNLESKKLTVIFPPWHGAGKAMTALENRLVKAGSAVLSIDLHGQILEANYQNVLNSFVHAQQLITAKLNSLVDTYKYTEINYIGISVGVVLLALVARSYTRFSTATFVVAGDRIAPVLWNGTRTKEIRKKFEKDGVSLKDLELVWKDIDPVLCIPIMKDKTVRMVLSMNDRFVPTHNQLMFAAEMKVTVNDTHTIHSRLGHAANIAAFCFRGDI